MVDRSGTPFWGSQKPLKHYFHNGVLTFRVRGNSLCCDVQHISKKSWGTLGHICIKDKEHLDRLLTVKELKDVVSHLV